MQIFGEIGYDIAAGNIAVTPFARLAHVDTGSDAFTETGGNAELTVGKADQKTTFLSLGARAQFNAGQPGRSEERRVGKERVRTGGAWWSRNHEKTKKERERKIEV